MRPLCITATSPPTRAACEGTMNSLARRPNCGKDKGVGESFARRALQDEGEADDNGFDGDNGADESKIKFVAHERVSWLRTTTGGMRSVFRWTAVVKATLHYIRLRETVFRTKSERASVTNRSFLHLARSGFVCVYFDEKTWVRSRTGMRHSFKCSARTPSDDAISSFSFFPFSS